MFVSLCEYVVGVSVVFVVDFKFVVFVVLWYMQCDCIVEVVVCFGMLIGMFGKIVCDVLLQMQIEVGEFGELVVVGKGGLLMMLYKCNLVGCVVVLMVVVCVLNFVVIVFVGMVQEYECVFGGWQVEWDVLFDFVCLMGGVFVQIVQIVVGFDVNIECFVVNFDFMYGLIFGEVVMFVFGDCIGWFDVYYVVEYVLKEVVCMGVMLFDVFVVDVIVLVYLLCDVFVWLFDFVYYVGEVYVYVDVVFVLYVGVY